MEHRGEDVCVGCHHSFFTDTARLPKHCHVCGGRVWGRKRLKCEVCQVYCHFRCAHRAPLTCLPRTVTPAFHHVGNALAPTSIPLVPTGPRELVDSAQGQDTEFNGDPTRTTIQVQDHGCTQPRKETVGSHLVPQSGVPPEVFPIVAVVNELSGGQLGAKIARGMRMLLGHRQVIDVMGGRNRKDVPGPTPLLCMYKDVENLRILVCGGDGTVAWVLTAIKEVGLDPPPPIAVLPLGTGNDLARVFGWGSGYKDCSLRRLLMKVERADPVFLDRWNLRIENRDGSGDVFEHSMVNYFSIGFDAKTTFSFDALRKRKPHLFKVHQFVNQMWYAMLGVRDMVHPLGPCHKYLTLEMDGKQVPLPRNICSVVCLNISSFAGGVDLWNMKKPGDSAPTVSDGFIEVVGLRGPFHFGLCKIGLMHAVRLGQARSVKFTSLDPTKDTRKRKKGKEPVLYLQYDGEPLMRPTSIITLGHKDQGKMLQHRHPLAL